MALLGALGPGAYEARALDPQLTLRVSTPLIFSAAAGLTNESKLEGTVMLRIELFLNGRSF